MPGLVSYALRFLAVSCAFAASLLSIGLFMAGAGPDSFHFVARIWLLYCVSALVIGACLPRWWWLAIAVAWLPIMLAPEFIAGLVAGGTTPEALMFLSSPLVALFSGYAGARATRRWLPTLGVRPAASRQ